MNLGRREKKNIGHVDVFYRNQWAGTFISKYLDDGNENDLTEEFHI